MIKSGDKIYIPSVCYISRGSDDVQGGIATVDKVTTEISGGKDAIFITILEVKGTKYNWSRYLQPMQDKLKKEFGDQIAKPDPDIDCPWIETGDTVNGKEYNGPDKW